MSDEVKEVLDTFRVSAELRGDSLGAYVISMAHHVRLSGDLLGAASL